MAKRKPLNYSGIFFDSANLDEFKKWFATGILGGATTNPLILQKDNILDIPEHISKMIRISGPNFPISIEIPHTKMSKTQMIELALKYHNRFPANAVIKVPMDPQNPQKSYEVIYKLGQKGVRVNATLGLSMGQLVAAAEALRLSRAQGDNYVSLFWARRDEAKKQIVDKLIGEGLDPAEAGNQVPNAVDTLNMTLKYLENHSLTAKTIVGSIRNISQIEQAFAHGTDIVTIPPNLLSDWMYTQRGAETAQQFNDAYESVKDKIKLI